MTGESHLDDERLSAVVDGEARPSDTEHVAGCTECAARVRAWQEAARLIGEAPIGSAGARDGAVAAALEEAGIRRHRFPTWAAAAAAALVLVGGGALAAGLVAGSGGGSHPSELRTPGPAATAPTTEARRMAAPTSPTVPGLPQLGDIPDAAALAARLRPVTSLSAGSATAFEPSAAQQRQVATRCLTQAQEADSLRGTPPSYEATLTFAGRPAIVFVFPVTKAVVLSTANCAVLAHVSL